MNLTELRNRVKAITDYSPELTAYNEQIDGFINSAYYALWTEKRWKFAEKTVFLDIFPDRPHPGGHIPHLVRPRLDAQALICHLSPCFAHSLIRRCPRIFSPYRPASVAPAPPAQSHAPAPGRRASPPAPPASSRRSLPSDLVSPGPGSPSVCPAEHPPPEPSPPA